MAAVFPAVGNRYLVDFVKFRVELFFGSASSLTYTGVAPNGSRGQPSTVAINVESIVDQIFLVTWQKADKTSVVHIENYDNNTIVTNITNPDNTFEQYHGTMKKLISYSSDIRPLFRASDIACMATKGVKLDNFAWLSDPGHAQKVYAKLQSGAMPPDGAWSQDKLSLFKDWIDDGHLS